MFLTYPNQPNLLRSPLPKCPRALSELFSPLPKYLSNTFGARGMEEFLEFLFFLLSFLGFELAFGRPNRKKISKKKEIKKLFRSELAEARVYIV